MLNNLEQPTRRDRKRVEMRDRIYEAAVALFSEFDYDQVTIEMITRKADVGKGTFFNHFANKEAVIAYFFQEQLERGNDALFGIAQREPGKSALQSLIQAIHLVGEKPSQNKKFVRVMLALSLINEQVRDANRKLESAGHDIALAFLKYAMDAGEIRSDIDIEECADLCISLYVGCLFDFASCDKVQDLHAEIDRKYRFLFEGIVSRVQGTS
jgi:AcrR family transcriptional regulator